MFSYASQAEKYYQLMADKNVEEVKKILHSNVEFSSPLTALKGKEAVTKAVQHFMNAFSTLTIRAKFGSENQAVIIYDVEISGTMNSIPTASLLTFQDGLISRIELFFDTSRFK